MKSVLKFLATAIGLVLVLVAIMAIFMSAQFTNTLDGSIERTLGYIYQTQVTVDDVSLAPSRRTLTIEGITVFNPEPFRAGPAMEIGEVVITANPLAFMRDTPSFDEIVIKDAKVHLRYEAGRGTNLGKLDQSAARLGGSGADMRGDKQAQRRFLIRKFRCDAAHVELEANFLPGPRLAFDIEPFEMDEVSGDARVSTMELCLLFIRSIFRESLSLRGLMRPVAEKLSEEWQRVQEHGEPSPAARNAPPARAE